MATVSSIKLFDFVEHYQLQIREGKKLFNFDICDTKFSSKPIMNGHIKSSNEGTKPFNAGKLVDFR